MKIESSKGRAHISVNPRGTGAGVVVQQGRNRLLMSWQEWHDLRNAIEILNHAAEASDPIPLKAN